VDCAFCNSLVISYLQNHMQTTNAYKRLFPPNDFKCCLYFFTQRKIWSRSKTSEVLDLPLLLIKYMKVSYLKNTIATTNVYKRLFCPQFFRSTSTSISGLIPLQSNILHNLRLKRAFIQDIYRFHISRESRSID
jgi:hypothetical protein